MPGDSSRTDAAKERLSNRGKRNGKNRQKPNNAPTVGDVLNSLPPTDDQSDAAAAQAKANQEQYTRLTQEAVDRAEAALGKRITPAERSMIAAKIAVQVVYGNAGFDPIAELAVIGANPKLASETRVKALTAVAKHTVPTLKSVELTAPEQKSKRTGEDPRAVVARAIGLQVNEEGQLLDEHGEVILLRDDDE